MRSRGWYTLLVLALGAAGGSARAAEPAGPGEVRALAARIDHIIEAELAAQKVEPVPLADDAAFLRRVYLDLVGRTPLVSEARRFLEDRRSDKRQALVEQLLAGSQHVRHFTHVWRDFLLGTTNIDQGRFLAGRLENWLRPRLQRNQPYDQLVRELLTLPLDGVGGPGSFDGVAFYQANELKPENLAASTTRLFLGVRLECAQCHNHPFAHWKREQFWQMAAFFSGIRSRNPQAGVFAQGMDDADRHEIDIPGGSKTVQARFLDGKKPAWDRDARARLVLAQWLTARDNPYFARTAANRLWAHFFGIGLVDPPDDFNDANPPSHPELLDELAAAFVRHDFDSRFLIRAITASSTYQRGSAVRDPRQAEPHLFARMALKGLSAEQLYESLAAATGYEEPAPGNERFFALGTARDRFLAGFANPTDRRTEQQTSILQALTLMNGGLVARATSLEQSGTLAAVADAPFLDHRQRLDILFLAALSRPPHDEEMRRLLPYLERGGPGGSPRKALADVFWVLLNSSEFMFNH